MRLRSALAVALVACAPVARPVAPMVEQAPKAAVTPTASNIDTIVLLAPNDWAALAADGTVLAMAEGVRIAVGSRFLTMKQNTVEATYPCDFGPNPDEHVEGEYRTQSLSLVDPEGNEWVLIAQLERQRNDFAQQLQSTLITGVVGPYVFTEESQVHFACGDPHGGNVVTSHVFDVRTGGDARLSTSYAALDAASAALAARGLPGQDIMHAEATPDFDAEGHLALRWRYEKPSSYEDSDNDGSTATVSSVQLTSELPEELEAYRDPPVALARYLATHPPQIVLGWSRPSRPETERAPAEERDRDSAAH